MLREPVGFDVGPALHAPPAGRALDQTTNCPTDLNSTNLTAVRVPLIVRNGYAGSLRPLPISIDVGNLRPARPELTGANELILSTDA